MSYRVIAVAVTAALLGGVLGGCDGDEGNDGNGGNVAADATPDEPDLMDVAGIVVQEGVCSIVDSEPAKQAAGRILERASGGRLKGGLLVNSVMATAAAACPLLLEQAAKVVGQLFDESRDPAETPTKQDVTETLVSADAASVASELGVGEHVVGATVQNVCAVMTGQRLGNPVSEITSEFPSAKLEDLGALNRLMALVPESCSPSGQQMSQLSSGIVSFLIAKSFEPDLAPPIVIGPLTNGVSRNADGSYAMDITWFASDFGSGVSRHSLWASVNGGAYAEIQGLRINSNGNMFTTNVTSLSAGATYRFALTTVDTAGNWSPWSYSQPRQVP